MLAAIPFAALLSSSVARADAAAEALFEEGRKLAQAGRFADACPKFEESLRLQPGVGTEFNLADCLEHTGKTASAWGHYRSVLAAAKLAGQTAREKVVQERIAHLEPGLCRLRIHVENGPGVTVERDGAPVGEGQWDTAVPIDPGEHSIVAKAPGKVGFKRTVDVSSCSQPFVVTIPRLDVDPSAPPASSRDESTPSREPATVTTSNGTRTALIVSGLALTAVGVGITAGFGAASLSAKNEAAPHCKQDGSCDQDGLGFKADALRYGDMATVGLVTASVFAVATVVVVIAMPSTKTVTALNLARGTITF